MNDMTSKHKKIYMIEFFRVFFVFFIILGHLMQSYPDVKNTIYSVVGSKLIPTWFCVELFSLIGGFLIYKKAILTDENIFSNIGHIYIRLLSAVLFFFAIAYILGITHLYNLPYVLSMTQGMSLGIADAIGWGDWFIGAYFWSITFCFVLLAYFKEKAFIFLVPMAFILLGLRYNHPYPGWMKAYSNCLGTEFSRVLSCVVLGTYSCFISEHLHIHHRHLNSFFFGLFEFYCIYWCFCHILTDQMSPIAAIMCFCFLLIFGSKSAGFISKFLNKQSSIFYLSRYSFGIFLGVGMMQSLMLLHFSKLSSDVCSLVITGGVY